MAQVSTFELLLKPQLPKELTDRFPELAPLARKILQGYFVSISNLSSDIIYLSLVLTTKTPGLEKNKIFSTLDTSGQNSPVSTVMEVTDDAISGSTIRTRFSFPLTANDTALFIVQPDATNADLLESADYELRGYSEIFLGSKSNVSNVKLLVTPEHRGTFFGETPASLGEVAYALPLANGGSLIELTQ